MELAFIIILELIILLVVDIRISAYIDYDIFSNIGYVRIKIFCISIFTAEISLTSEYFKLVHGKKKVIQINLLSINRETIRLIEDVSKAFVRKINLVELNLDCKMCGEDPFAVAMASGFIRSIFGLALTKVQASYPYSILNNDVKSVFFGNELYLALSGKIFINIYDFVWAVARAIYIRRFGNYGEKGSLYERRERKHNY